MNKINIIFLAILFLGFSACSPVVYTDKAPDANFGSYQTYAMLPTGDNSQTNTIYTDKIIREINQEMQARGYELDNQNPDLLVNVKTMYDQEQELVTTGYYPATYDYYGADFYAPTTLAPYYYTGYAGIPSIAGPDIRQVEYTQGTFVVDIIEAQGKNNIIWRGWSKTPVDPSNLDESIRSYVDNIFEEYPVEADEQYAYQ